MKYTETDIIKFLTKENRKIGDYLVVSKKYKTDAVLYFIYENVLFFDIIEDKELYLACIEYIRARGQSYESDEQLRKVRPELIFG